MYWDDEDSQGMSDFQKEYIAALLNGKMPDLMNEIRKTAEKFDNDVRKSRHELMQTIEKTNEITKEQNNDVRKSRHELMQTIEKTNGITKEQNKNFTKIPRVLMIRANSLNHWFYWAMGICAYGWLTKTIATARQPYDPNDFVLVILIFGWVMIICWVIVNFYTSFEKGCEVDKIREKMLRYQEGIDDCLDFDFGGFGINRGVIIRYLSKKNPEIFDKLIRNPSSVKNGKVIESIILGRLRNCPGDAQRVLDVFGKSLSNKVLRRVQRYNNIQK